MKKLFIVYLVSLAGLSTIAQAEGIFEVDPQIRPKISLNGAIAKDWVFLSGEEVALDFGKVISAGAGLTFEYPFVQNFALGVQGKILFDSGKKGPRYYDINLIPKIQFDLSEGAVSSNIYLGFPAGFSIMHWDQLNGLGKGFNAGLMLGSHFYFAERFGFFTELGYSYKRISTALKLPGGDKDLTFSFSGLAVSLGLSVGF